MSKTRKSKSLNFRWTIKESGYHVISAAAIVKLSEMWEQTFGKPCTLYWYKYFQMLAIITFYMDIFYSISPIHSPTLRSPNKCSERWTIWCALISYKIYILYACCSNVSIHYKAKPIQRFWKPKPDTHKKKHYSCEY